MQLVQWVVDTVWEWDIIPIGLDSILIDNADEKAGRNAGFLEDLRE